MINEFEKGYFRGLILMFLLLVLPVMFSVYHVAEVAYERGQRDAILGNIKYEMKLVPADTVWIRKEK
jgi:hypothetical protein